MKMDDILKAATKRPWDVQTGRSLLHIETANTGDGSPCGMPACSLPKAHNADALLIVEAMNLFDLHEAVAKAAGHYRNGTGSHSALDEALSALAAAKEGK